MQKYVLHNRINGNDSLRHSSFLDFSVTERKEEPHFPRFCDLFPMLWSILRPVKFDIQTSINGNIYGQKPHKIPPWKLSLNDSHNDAKLVSFWFLIWISES